MIDPEQFLIDSYEFVTSPDGLAQAMLVLYEGLKSDLDTLLSGSDYEQAKVAGRYTTDILIALTTGGVVNTAKKSSMVIKLSKSLNRAGKSLKIALKQGGSARKSYLKGVRFAKTQKNIVSSAQRLGLKTKEEIDLL